jgi:tetratricopeptide (TPR) repeat protein
VVRDAALLAVMQPGVEAAAAGDYAGVLPMLDHIASTDLAPELRGLVLIVAARACLRAKLDVGEAAKRVDRAAELLPDDGRVCAACGDYLMARESVVQYIAQISNDVEGEAPPELEAARKNYEEAIELSPNEPAGHIGLGGMHQQLQLWDDADDHYALAVDAARSRASIDGIDDALARLLAPVNGNLFLQLARMLRREGPEAALAAIDRALELGVEHAGAAPQRLAHRMRAEILEALDRRSDAAEALDDAASGFLEREEPELARECLRRAIELAPQRVGTYWVLADTLRLCAQRATGIDASVTLLDEARGIWTAGSRIRLPNADDAWAYTVHGVILDQLARSSSENARELFWEAAVNIERGLILQPWSANPYCQLSRYYRALRLSASALDASAACVEKGAGSDWAWEERVIVLSSTTRTDDARAALASREGITREPAFWYDAVRAYLAFHDEKIDEALPLIDRALETAPSDACWCLELRAACHRRRGDAAKARADYEAIWNRYSPGARENRDNFALAAYALRLPEATALLTDLLKDPANAPRAKMFLGLESLRAGNLGAQASIAEAVRDSDATELHGLLWLELPDLEHGKPDGDPLLAVTRGLREDAAARLATIDDATAMGELESVLQESSEGPTTSQWIGAMMGFARLSGENAPLDRLRMYRELQRRAPHVEEANAGFAQALVALEDKARSAVHDGHASDASDMLSAALRMIETDDATTTRPIEDALATALVHAGRSTEAAPYLEKLLEHQNDAKVPSDQARAEARLGYARFDTGAKDEAHRRFARALELLLDTGIDAAGQSLGETCRELVADLPHYWSLDAFLAEQTRGASQEITDGVAAARAALDTYVATRLEMDRQDERLRVVSPIVIEVARAIVPDDAAAAPLLQAYLPDMRERVRAEMGVRVPGVRIRGDDGVLPDDSYVIMLDEVPVVPGRIVAHSQYCPETIDRLAALGISRDKLVAADNPVTGGPGCWVDDEEADRVLDAGLTLWPDSRLYMIGHVEGVMRANLVYLLGVQEVENMIDEWRNDEGLASLIDAALPDSAARFRFGRMLQALVKERVPITNTRALLETMLERAPEEHDVTARVAAARLRLRETLPGNEPATTHVALSDGLEALVRSWIWHRGGRTFCAIPPEETQELLDSVRALVGQYEISHIALLVADASVRPFVRRIIELEFPRLAVLARDELVRGPQTPSAPVVQSQVATVA